ncbi:MAG: hypothetical protein AAF567_22615 [Actinomycetota bacterium]
MTMLEDRVREAIGASPVIPISLPASEEITARGRRRQRRQRIVLGAAGAVVLVVGVLAFTTGGRNDDGAVFAGTDDSIFLAPATYAVHGDVLVGYTLEADPDEMSAQIQMVESRNGLVWRSFDVVGAHAHLDPSILPAPIVVDGDVAYVGWVVDDRLVAERFDLAERTWLEPLDLRIDGLERDGERVTATRLVVRRGLVAVRMMVGGRVIEGDDRPICGFESAMDLVAIRPCGATEFEEVEMPGSPTPPRIVAAVGGAERDAPLLVVTDSTYPGSTPYVIDGGIGVGRRNGACVRVCDPTDGSSPPGETTDGETWVDPFGPLTQVNLVAAHGEQRLVAENFGPRRISEDQPVSGLWFRPGPDPDDWVAVDLGPLLGFRTGRPEVFNDLVGGPEGWVLHYARFAATGTPQIADVSRIDFEPFIVTGSDYTLSGTLPFGEATLRNRDGELVHEWAHFEPFDPDLDLVPTGGGTLTLSVEAVQAEFSWADWTSAIEPGVDATAVLAFSHNGVDWEHLELPEGLIQGPIVLHDGAAVVTVSRGRVPHTFRVPLPERDDN